MKPDGMLVEAKMIEQACMQVARSNPAEALKTLRGYEPALAAFISDGMALLAGRLALEGAPPHVIRHTHEAMLGLVLTCLTAVRQAHFELWKDTAVGTRLAQFDPKLARRTGRRGRGRFTGGGKARNQSRPGEGAS